MQQAGGLDRNFEKGWYAAVGFVSLVEFKPGLLYDWEKNSSKEMENIYEFI